MKHQTKAILLIIGLVAVVGMATWLSLSPSIQIQTGHLSTPAIPKGFIQFGHPVRKSFTKTITVWGRVESINAVSVVALEAGEITRIYHEVGDRVKRGTPLFKIGGRRLEKRISSLSQQVGLLREALQTAKANLISQKEAYKRHLVKIDQIFGLKEKINRLQKQLMELKTNLEMLKAAQTITSPLDGMLTQRKVGLGQMVSQGMPLAQITDVTHLRIRACLFGLPLSDLQRLHHKRVIIEGKLLGRVDRVLPERTSDGGTLIWITAPGLERQFCLGEIVGCQITLSSKKGLFVPETAVIFTDHHAFVFVRDKMGVHRLEVKTGEEQNGLIEVTSANLRPQNEIMTQGAYECFYRYFSRAFKVAD